MPRLRLSVLSLLDGPRGAVVVVAEIVRLAKCVVFAYDVEMHWDNVRLSTGSGKGGTVFPGTSSVTGEEDGRFCDCPRQQRLYWRRNSSCLDFGASQEICPLKSTRMRHSTSPLAASPATLRPPTRFAHLVAIRAPVRLHLERNVAGESRRSQRLCKAWGAARFRGQVPCSAMPRGSSSPPWTS